MSGVKTLTVDKNGPLLEYLINTLSGYSRNELKRFLKYHSICVNGKMAHRHDHPLLAGDRIDIKTDKKDSSERDFLRSRLQIVHEDEDLLVINKPAGLLSISTEKITDQTAYHHVNQYLNLKERVGKRAAVRSNQKKIFVVHRLDREVSGLLLFAKAHAVKQRLQANWHEVQKRYYAIVEGIPDRESGRIESFLRENKYLNVYSAPEPEKGKHSVTEYELIRHNPHYALLEICLKTGRKHQIRVHLSDLGHPIVGDRRYGSKHDPLGRLGLHAYYLAFPHPVAHKKIILKTDLPIDFQRIISAGNAIL